MRFRTVLLALVLTTTALTGCLTGDEEAAARARGGRGLPPDWQTNAVPHGEGHDHRDPAHHQDLSTPNFQVLGWDPLITDYHGTTSGSYFCGQAASDGERRLAFVHSFWSDVAFVVADVTDPENPEIIGELVMPLTHVYDVAVTPDLQHVVLATSPLDTGPDGEPSRASRTLAPRGEGASALPYFRDACTGEERPVRVDHDLFGSLPLISGAVLVDVSDPTDPFITDYEFLPLLGPHSIFATDVGDETVVLASITNLVHAISYYAFFTVVDTPLGGQLLLQSTYRPMPELPGPLTNGHVDGWIQEHPITGQVLAYLADWDGGMVIADVTDLTMPTLVGHWHDRGGSGNDGGNIHGTLPIEGLWDGKHYTFVGQEVTSHPSRTPSGLIFLLDTTDPENPTLVSNWTLPVEVEWEETLQFSTHYFRLLGKTLFIAMYHAGVWAVDFSDVTAPETKGVFIPDNVSPSPAGALDQDQYDWAPTVLDLDTFPDEVGALDARGANGGPGGTIVVFDGTSGVYTLRFLANGRIGPES